MYKVKDFQGDENKKNYGHFEVLDAHGKELNVHCNVIHSNKIMTDVNKVTLAMGKTSK